MSTGTTTSESRTLRHNVSWQEYVALRDGNEHRNTRMTYDRGSLELMSPGRLHERLRIVIGECVKAWCAEMRISYQSCGSTTFRREDLERGLEPDNCFYIQNLSVVRDREDGPHFRERPGCGAAACAAIAKEGVNILAISTSLSSIACMVDGAELAATVRSLQRTFELPNDAVMVADDGLSRPVKPGC